MRSGFKDRVRAVALLVAVAAGLGSCKGGPGDLGINLKLEETQLSNGLKVILVEDHTVPLVSYQSWFRVGSVDEHPGITGISHLFEHLMFKGTPKYPEKEFFLQLEAKGAEVNAFTTRDYTVYYENFVPGLLPKVVEMESDRLANLTLTQQVLDSERMVVFEERRMRTDNSPDGRMQEALWALAFQQHPYHWPVIGYPEDLTRITLPELIDYFKSHYQPANAAIVVVGDIDAKKTIAMIKGAYESIPAQPRPKRDIPNESEQSGERRLELRDHVASERFAQAYHIVSALDDDAYSLDVLANILFAGTTSRAYQLLVEQKDAAAGVAGTAFTPSFPGLFIVNASMKAGVPAATGEALVADVIREVQEKGVTDEEVKVAVKQLTVQLVDSVRTFNGLGNLIGTVQTVFDDPKRFAEDLAKYQKVTRKDVQRVAQKYLVPNNRSVVTLSPLPPGAPDAAAEGAAAPAPAQDAPAPARTAPAAKGGKAKPKAKAKGKQDKAKRGGGDAR